MTSDPQRFLDRLERASDRFETSWGAGRMVWHAWGSGPPLVLFHGGAGSWRHWVRNIGFFAARGRRVVCADLPGLGESDDPPAPDDPPSMAALITNGLRAVIGDEQYDLAGFSFGGSMAGVVAAHRINLARLMIADPANIDATALVIQDWNSARSRLNSPAISGGTWLLRSL